MKKEAVVGHRSFSSFTSWIRCGKAWELERKLQAPSEPAWWFVGGQAFHAAAERFLLNEFKKSQETYKFTDVPF
jgi:hypothetical protein